MDRLPQIALLGVAAAFAGALYLGSVLPVPAVSVDPLVPTAAWRSHKYCIVGAGPAGVQLGEFLFEAKHDYVIIDKAPQAGSFFARLPVHRNLISINKRYTRAGQGSADSDFALRHDWNSLLDGGSNVPPFQERSDEYWPHADDMSSYIQDFAKRQVEAGKVLLNHEVSRVARSPTGQGRTASKSKYMLSVKDSAGHERRVGCEAGWNGCFFLFTQYSQHHDILPRRSYAHSIVLRNPLPPSVV